jgi:hypothetical protein
VGRTPADGDKLRSYTAKSARRRYGDFSPLDTGIFGGSSRLPILRDGPFRFSRDAAASSRYFGDDSSHGIYRSLWLEMEECAWALALLATVTVSLTTRAYQPLLFPALLVLVASANAIRKTSFLVRTLAKGILACLLWQWGTALGLGFCSMFEPPSRLQNVAELPMYTLLALPALTLLVVVGAILLMGAQPINWTSQCTRSNAGVR